MVLFSSLNVVFNWKSWCSTLNSKLHIWEADIHRQKPNMTNKIVLCLLHFATELRHHLLQAGRAVHQPTIS
uniref:Uncharacterized protein n=1 Tax=Arundo donax TaxID=35708 RepID=A0A0A9DFS5_ARUDO